MTALISGMPDAAISGFEPIVFIRKEGVDVSTGTFFGRMSSGSIYPNKTMEMGYTYYISLFYIASA